MQKDLCKVKINKYGHNDMVETGKCQLKLFMLSMFKKIINL